MTTLFEDFPSEKSFRSWMTSRTRDDLPTRTSLLSKSSSSNNRQGTFVGTVCLHEVVGAKGRWKLGEWKLGEWNLSEWKMSEWKNSESIFADFHKLLNSKLVLCSFF